MNNVYIMSANRSAIGGFGGTLKNHCPVDLGTLVAKEAIERSGYEAYGSKRLIKSRNKFNKVKLKVKKDRLNGNFHRKEFNIENVDRCDSCLSKPKKNSLDLHHIILLEDQLN